MSTPLRVETRLDAHSHRDDVLGAHVLAERGDPAPPLAVRVLMLEMECRGIRVSLEEVEQMARRCLAAGRYAARIRLVTDRLRAGIDPRD